MLLRHCVLGLVTSQVYNICGLSIEVELRLAQVQLELTYAQNIDTSKLSQLRRHSFFHYGCSGWLSRRSLHRHSLSHIL